MDHLSTGTDLPRTAVEALCAAMRLCDAALECERPVSDVRQELERELRAVLAAEMDEIRRARSQQDALMNRLVACASRARRASR